MGLEVLSGISPRKGTVPVACSLGPALALAKVLGVGETVNVILVIVTPRGVKVFFFALLAGRKCPAKLHDMISAAAYSFP